MDSKLTWAGQNFNFPIGVQIELCAVNLLEIEGFKIQSFVLQISWNRSYSSEFWVDMCSELQSLLYISKNMPK